MAARRLLIVMLVLLGISSVIAIMIPAPSRDDNTPEETATGATGATGLTGTTGSAGSTGEVAGQSPGPDPVERRTVTMEAAKLAEVKATAGSRMILTVKSKQGSDVEIEGLGLAAFADPYAPAVFDVILPSKPGRYPVTAPGEKPSAVIVTGS